METKSFRARSVPEAVAAVKAAFGPGAVVLKTRAVTGPRGQKEIEIIAGQNQPQGGPRITKPIPPGGNFAPIAWDKNRVPTQNTPSAPAPAPASNPLPFAQPAIAQPTAAKAAETNPASESKLLAEFASLRRLVRSSLSSRPGVSLGLPQQLAMLMDRLLGQGIDLDATESIIQQARESLTPQELRDDIVVRHAALRAIESLLPPAAELPARGSRIALVGPHGCGKTTTIAKLAAAAKFRRGQSVTLVSLDRQKVGGAEQLRAYADVLDVPFRSASTKSQLAEVLREVNTDLVFIDTAGVSWRSAAELGQLADMLALLDNGEGETSPRQVHLALPGSLATDTLRTITRAFAALSPTHQIITRVDEAPALGNIVGTLDAKLPLSGITAGPNVPDDIEPGSPAAIARRILGTGFAV